MTRLSDVYRCSICGNIVEVLHTGKGALVCCGKPMELVAEQTSEHEYREKHVPVVTKTDSGVKVEVGSVPHPMKDEHYIEWVEVIDGGHVSRRVLRPGDAPQTEFCDSPAPRTVRAYCNLHGLWRAEP